MRLHTRRDGKSENMTRAQSQNSTSQTDHRRILLLGDDGRMERMLRARFHDYPVLVEPNVLEGIIRQGYTAGEVILLNAELLGEKTTQAVQALRRISPEVLLLVYGEPFTEGYGRAARAAGADDYLIWPVPARELRYWLQRDTQGKAPEQADQPSRPALARETIRQEIAKDRTIETATTRAIPDLLQRYRELAQLIPKGQAVLIEQAQQVMTQALGLERITIHAATTEAADNEPAPDPSAENEPAIILNGPAGPVGWMQLGPKRTGQPANEAAVQLTADFLGTLLYLVKRDENLKYLATVDELTGAYNRRYLEYFLRQVIEQSKHEHTEVALLLFDIDDFKHYNDTYGHAAGDEILCEATRLMRRCCRAHDVVARMGGDEFAVLFWDTGQPREVFPHENNDKTSTDGTASEPRQPTCQATRARTPLQQHPEVAVFLSNRFRRIMNTSEFPSLGPEARGILTISGGLACYPWDGDTVEDLLAKADEALLSAKRSGKNRIYLVGRPNEKNHPTK